MALFGREIRSVILIKICSWASPDPTCKYPNVNLYVATVPRNISIGG